MKQYTEECPICEDKRVIQECITPDVGKYITKICFTCNKAENIFIPDKPIDFMTIPFTIKK
ncbi:MAG TPA: hypothetical protein VK190_04870 [Pseudoneobacillus sp.]|nr:hypothetical protein [Pseudoneobacillus sp.]